MKSNSQLSLALHLLLHMADMEEPVTSGLLASAMNTNPVVIRRLMGGLREHGIVQSRKGHHGGWTLSRPLAELTLRDVYLALGGGPLLSLTHRTQNPDCLIEQAVNETLDGAFRDAEALLLARFADLSLAALQSRIHAAIHSPAHLCA
ncbi:Rrf2 family transcriptional regulator [Parvibaculum sp.]|uniref:Rrf2 family transcriptional regulator n=1 Tax=Parvibaculum sp. TaxID=2024848 RepID=UPI000C964461|nr:Rrf2 family transcriptional regulator [Parvibaculum sp.]MAB14613.1 transcriptional regulator [Parvibaculum sp.]